MPLKTFKAEGIVGVGLTRYLASKMKTQGERGFFIYPSNRIGWRKIMGSNEAGSPLMVALRDHPDVFRGYSPWRVKITQPNPLVNSFNAEIYLMLLI